MATTFVVSLFLPYTINFASRKADVKPAGSVDSQQSLLPRPLFSGTGSLLVGTTPPGSPNRSDVALFGPELDVSTPAVHFAKPSDPRTLARSDAHVPEWGRGRVYNQPLAKATLAPPSTILAYAKGRERRASSNMGANHMNSMSRTRERDSAFTPIRPPRDVSREKSVSRADWTVEPALQGNGGLTNAVRAAEEKGALDSNVIRIGTLGFPTDDLGLARRDEIVETLESGYDSICVIVSDKDFDSHYRQYCKTILWPVFHYQIPDHPKSKAYEDHSWKYYVKINEAFTKQILESYKHGDTIWIHDYHLMLVPSMLRKKLPDAKIGFFLHTAFPSSEVFRCLASRKQLLQGILGATLVAFQTSEYANHFLQTCSRLLVVETTDRGVQLEDHFVEVAHCAIGTVIDRLILSRSEPDVQKWIQTLTNKYKGKALLVGRDKLDSIRGVKQKLLAFEMFLDDNPGWKGRVVLIQVATSAASDQQGLDTRVSDIVTRVNSKHSTLDHQPVVFLKQDIAFHQYLALLSAADVLMVTSLREGMNLTCHDFVICQDGQHASSKKHGPLILSEFAGSSEVFQGNELAVNPWDYQQMSRAIKYSLQMSDAEKETRYIKLSQLVAQGTGLNWVRRLQTKLDAAYETHKLKDTMSLPRLSTQSLGEAYYHATNALIILDYEGTLQSHAPIVKGALGSSPQRLLDTLNDLVTMQGNSVYVTSARTKADMEQCFSEVAGLGLVAENGCFVRPCGQEDWTELVDTSPETVREWKEGVLSLLSYYKERQKGSWIEEKESTMVYHYANAPTSEAEAALKQAGDAANHINDSCQGQRMRAIPLDKAVIIEPYDVDKATAAEWILRSTYGLSPDDNVADLNIADKAPDIEDMDYFQEKRDIMEDPGLAATMEQLAISHPVEMEVSANSALDTPPSVSRVLDHSIAPPPSASSNALAESSRTRWPEFLLVAGDDREDEPVFRWANNLKQGSREERADSGDEEEGERKIRDVFSVCVGKKNTEASSTLTQGAMGMVAALQKLTGA